MAVTTTIELFDDPDWVEIPVRTWTVTETSRNPVTELSFSLVTGMLTTAQKALLTLERLVHFTHDVDGEDFSFYARIKELPRTLLNSNLDADTFDVKCYGESHDATRYRFVDSWPKTGITTYEDIIEDAWTNYGPSGITFVGVDAGAGSPDYIASNLGTLYEFMEDIANRTGWRWKVVDGDLQFFDPTAKVSEIGIDGTSIRPETVISEGTPEVANVVFVPALFNVEDFEDSQNAVDGQLQYFMQYPPRKGYGVVEEYFKPQVFVDGVEIDPADIAQDGAYGSATAIVVYNLDNRFIRFAAGEGPAAGLVILIIYDATFPFLIQRVDQASIDLYGPIHHAIKRSPRPTREEAIEIGDAYLAIHAFPVSMISAEMLEKRIRCGWYHQVTLSGLGIDQLMPVESTTRSWANGKYTVKACLSQAPVTDAELIFDLFRRLERLEARDIQDEIMERQYNIEDTWVWTDEVLAYWSDVNWIAGGDTPGHELKHLSLYICEQEGARFVYPC